MFTKLGLWMILRLTCVAFPHLTLKTKNYVDQFIFCRPVLSHQLDSLVQFRSYLSVRLSIGELRD
ncbi:hypothetical protein IPJ72_05685 [Candidatus Peregrinibacteria bacterium]|nr:MAG: hypothetical protein IPJ72_05685 [Candidatus Peregrinibacteria bacterium]